MGKLIDLTGKKFGSLTVIERVQNKNNRVYWLCRCDCGNEKIIASDSLRQGLTLSCGCLHKKIVAKTCKNNFLKHGLAKTRINNIYHNMKRRCLDKTNKNYGKRGIQVCEEWSKFENFYNWAINNGYQDDLTIDRIDNNGNYEPSNCRWVNYKKQANNTRKNCNITYNNKTHTLIEWAELKGIKVSTLWMRLNKYNWSIEKTLTYPHNL